MSPAAAPHSPTADRMARALACAHQSRPAEGLAALQAHDAPDAPDTPEVQTLARALRGQQAVHEGRLAEGIAALQAALPELLSTPWREQLDPLLVALAHALGLEGDPLRGLEWLLQAEAALADGAAPARQRKVRSTEGMLRALVGDRDGAQRCLAAVCALAAAEGDARAQAIAWGNLAYLALDHALSAADASPAERLALLTPALPAAASARAHAQAAGLPLYEGFAALPVGFAHAWAGETEAAVAELEAAVAQTAAQPSMQADAWLGLACTHRLAGDVVRAQQAVQAGLALARREGLPVVRQRLLDEAIALADAQGDRDAAEAALREALAHQRESERRRLHALARHAALLGEAAQARREAHGWAKAAQHDPLTGALNRRGLDVQRSARGDRGASLLALDVDHFKRINDSLGHAVGDAVLRELARVLRQHLRPADLLARLGGEEFLVLCEGSDPAHALRLAERLRAAVEAADWPALAPELAVRISLGVAAQAVGEPWDAALARADAALYEAKRQGRNRVVGAA